MELEEKIPQSKTSNFSEHNVDIEARLAQSVERKTLNLVVVGSSPTVGTSIASISGWWFLSLK